MQVSPRQTAAFRYGTLCGPTYTLCPTMDKSELPIQPIGVFDSGTGGLTVVPDFTFDDAPTPAVVVVGAQGRSDTLLQWLRRIGSAAETEVLMSVCTGAFKLADAGLLAGKHATTHHDFFDEFSRRHPDVTLERGRRFVQSGPHLFTAGGLTSGIDLALHVVALYYGDATAQEVARYMEYRQGQQQ